MADIIKKEDLLYLFNNGDKPSAQDFEAFIDFADSDTIWIRHEVNGTGKRSIEVDVNEFLTFTRRYGEVHVMAHITGTYIFTELEFGTYGNGAISTTLENFMHISPHPNIINDDSPDSEYNTLSAKYINDNFDDQTELENNYISRIRDTKVTDPSVDIQSYGDIKATNIINDIIYQAGNLEMHKGSDDKAYVDKFHLSPDLNIRFIGVPASVGAPDIVKHYNGLSDSVRTFRKGDLVFLQYDLTDVEDEDGDKTFGIRHYIIRATFDYEYSPFTITNVENDLITLTTVSLHNIMSRVYTKEEVDVKLTAASQGITGSYDVYVDIPYSDGGIIAVEGNSVIVQDYTAGEGGAVETGKRGVFRFTENFTPIENSWRFMYTQRYDHHHLMGDIDDMKEWTKLDQGAVKLQAFLSTDQSLHFTLPEQTQIVTNKNNITSNDGDIANNLTKINTLFSTTNAHNIRIGQNETDITGLQNTKSDKTHLHDDRYYTESESNGRFLGINAKSKDSDKLDGHDSTYFSASTHIHDGRYYTESESNSRFLGISAKAKDSDKLDNRNSTSFANASHTHPISQVTSLQAELDNKADKSLLADVVPIGTIMLWANPGAVPNDNWHACDGGTYFGTVTPLIDGVFIRAASDPKDIYIDSTNPRGSDNAINVTHKHTGSGTTDSDGYHSHSYTASNGSWASDPRSGADHHRALPPGARTTGGGGSHTHKMSSFKINNSGTSGTGKNMPAYIVLTYIMKVK